MAANAPALQGVHPIPVQTRAPGPMGAVTVGMETLQTRTDRQCMHMAAHDVPSTVISSPDCVLPRTPAAGDVRSDESVGA